MNKYQILQFIGTIAAYGGGSAAFAYLIFTFLGKRWIESKFEKSLEELKHEHAEEIARLRVEIDSTLGGVLKIQEKEFEALPEAWKKLDDAYGQVRILVSPHQRYSDIDQMTPERLEEFLAQTKLLESEKKEVRESGKQKGRAYQEFRFWHRLQEVESVCRDFHNYAVKYSIFFPPAIRDKFKKIAEELWSALNYKQTGKEAEDHRMQREGWEKVEKVIKPMYEELEIEIYERLHSHSEKSVVS